MEANEFVFKGLILREGNGYASLCLDLDVASQGQTVLQAKDALLEAVTLYLETATESNQARLTVDEFLDILTR